jgi:hypothetical protein
MTSLLSVITASGHWRILYCPWWEIPVSLPSFTTICDYRYSSRPKTEKTKYLSSRIYLPHNEEISYGFMVSQVNPGRPKCPPSQTNWEKGRIKCFLIPRSCWSSTLSSAIITTWHIIRGGSVGSFCWLLQPPHTAQMPPRYLPSLSYKLPDFFLQPAF